MTPGGRFVLQSLLILLAGFGVACDSLFAQNSQVSQLKVKGNMMYIILSKTLSLTSLDSFVNSYNLREIGLHALVKSRDGDSLRRMGWEIDDKKEWTYTLTKKLGYTDLKDPLQRIIYSAVPTPDDWRIVGGNRVIYGVNKFISGEGFKQENGIVYFYLHGFKEVDRVRLAGSFTNWQFNAFPMRKTGEGWIVPVRLKPGQYFYKFIVGNDKWINDPDNRLSDHDGKGNINSMLFVTNQVFALKGYQEARQVYLSGSFNNWSQNAVQMKKTRSGWENALYLEPGTHTFYYVVDGKKIIQKDEQQQASLALGNATLFRLGKYPDARQVILAGDFNDWSKTALKMNRTSTGWELPYVLGPGNYQYKFIVDGKWITDPANPNIVDDGKGNDNSFLVVGANYTFRLKGYSKARNVRVAGKFNNWSSKGTLMRREGNDWICPVYLGRGKHLYKFIVDGIWMRDPANKLWEDGDENSVLWIE